MYAHTSNDVSGPYADVPFVKDIHRWRLSREGQRVLLAKATVGGHRVYPPVTHSLEQYMEDFPDDSPLKVCVRRFEIKCPIVSNQCM